MILLGRLLGELRFLNILFFGFETSDFDKNVFSFINTNRFSVPSEEILITALSNELLVPKVGENHENH